MHMNPEASNFHQHVSSIAWKDAFYVYSTFGPAAFVLRVKYLYGRDLERYTAANMHQNPCCLPPASDNSLG
jgi:hypothetical protein